MPTVKLLSGLRRFGGREQQVSGATVREALASTAVPSDLLYPDGATLNPDLEILVNGRNIAFLDGEETPVAASDRVTVFLPGVRGYPGG